MDTRLLWSAVLLIPAAALLLSGESCRRSIAGSESCDGLSQFAYDSGSGIPVVLVLIWVVAMIALRDRAD